VPGRVEGHEGGPALLDRYLGRYELVPGFWIDVKREDGQADGVTLHQGGQDMPGKRVER